MDENLPLNADGAAVEGTEGGSDSGSSEPWITASNHTEGREDSGGRGERTSEAGGEKEGPTGEPEGGNGGGKPGDREKEELEVTETPRGGSIPGQDVLSLSYEVGTDVFLHPCVTVPDELQPMSKSGSRS